jgi:hypothetical protein
VLDLAVLEGEFARVLVDLADFTMSGAVVPGVVVLAL